MEGMLKENCFSGKTIIVTGGGTGLGKSMATYLSTLGANIVIASRKQDVIDKTAAEITQETGNKVIAISCDIRNYQEIEKVIEESLNEFGEINGLINNAAGNFISPTERLSHRAFDTVVDIVLKGTYNFTLSIGKHWIGKKQPGNILNIITTYAWTGSGYVVPSACAKAGILGLTRSLAVEWGKYKIRSNAIAPGPFPTEGAWSRLFPGDVADKLDPVKRIPLNRVGEHHELANLAAYLISDFSGYINGEVVTIDGGEWLKGAGQFNDFEFITPEMWDMLGKMRKSQKG